MGNNEIKENSLWNNMLSYFFSMIQFLWIKHFLNAHVLSRGCPDYLKFVLMEHPEGTNLSSNSEVFFFQTNVAYLEN